MMETVGAYEAKTYLPKLLERGMKGERITITRHGVPVTVLQPPAAQTTRDAKSVIAEVFKFRSKHTLCGFSIREMIEEGRRLMGESFVVDNSIVMSWCFQDEINP
jgi:prevent-host-death family protein